MIRGYLFKQSNTVVTEREILKNVHMGDFEEVIVIIPQSKLKELLEEDEE